MMHWRATSGIGALRHAWARFYLRYRALAPRFLGGRADGGEAALDQDYHQRFYHGRDDEAAYAAETRSLNERLRLRRPAGERRRSGLRDFFVTRKRLLRRIALAVGVTCVVIGLPVGALWWRLSSGPVALDLVTPWLTSAIEERFGGRYRIEVGGTVLEFDEERHAAVRLRDLVVRDSDGTVVATAPKAEVGVVGMSLLTAQVQVRRVSLIGVVMSIRVEPDGQMSIFTAAEKPADHAAGSSPRPASAAVATSQPMAAGQSPGTFGAMLASLDGLDALGRDARDLTEIGLKSGKLVVDDRRNGKRWAFENINLSLTRPPEGGVAFAVNSVGADGPWSMIATVSPRGNGRRGVEAVIRDLSPKDLLLALRLGDGAVDADMPISALIRAEIAADGTLSTLEGKALVGAGHIGTSSDPEGRILVDEAQLNMRWDAASRQMLLPFEMLSGANRISLLTQVETPRNAGDPWAISIMRGQIVLSSADRTRDPPVIFDRVSLRAIFDPVKRRFELQQGDLLGMAASVSFSGVLDCSGAEPRLAAGLAGNRMTVATLKRLWPVFMTPHVREWVIENVASGMVDRFEIASNAPVETLKADGPPLPDNGLSVVIDTSATVVRPVRQLPPLQNANVAVRVNGRHASVKIDRATAELPSGRKLVFSTGAFDVADTHPKPPLARVQFRLEGGADAVAELLAMEPLRDSAGGQIEPATSRGGVTAQVLVGFPVTRGLTRRQIAYTVEADIKDFAVERMVRGQKLEASMLRVSANQQGTWVKGDVRIGGMPANIDYRKPAGPDDAEVRLLATLDDAARNRWGFELNNTIAGPVPIKLGGRIASSGDRDNRLTIEADLTQARIGDLFPGWIKASGKPGRASFVVVDKGSTVRIEDIVVDSAGTTVRGVVEVDSAGEIQMANFPTFGLSEGDKASLRAERASDGTLKVTMRGDVYDGRGFVKGAMSGPPGDRPKPASYDIDLDIKVGALTGFNGEALRGLDLRLSRRAGRIYSFGLNAKLGRDASLLGDLRAYNNGRQVVYFETADAGALFRFTDTYPRMAGGQMWIAMDPPSADQAPQEGQMMVRNFAVRGEAALERVAGGAQPIGDGNLGAGVAFSGMKVDFTKTPGRLTLRDGVVKGSAICATMEGLIDYPRDDVRMRGTFVPACGLNNVLNQVPIVGLFMGGQNEGVFGVTYEVVGPPHSPTLRVNPMSALAPGFTRKLFEFRSLDDSMASTPQPYRRGGLEETMPGSQPFRRTE